VTALKYSTYVDIDGVVGGQAPYIILHLDYDGDLVPDDLLFFEPVYQTAVFFPAFPQAALVPRGLPPRSVRPRPAPAPHAPAGASDRSGSGR